MKLTLGNLRQFIRDMGHVLLHGNLDSSDFFILDDKGVIYASIAKSACSSIKTSMAGDFPRGRSIHYHTREFSHKRIARDKRGYFCFSFVRNPYKRLVSSYRNKFNKEDEARFLYSNYLFGYLRNDDSFEEFVRKVTRLPDFLCDRHFKTQHSIIFSRGAKMDHVGKVEDLPADYEEIRERYDFNDLKILNKSRGTSSDELLTDEVKGLIHKRFKKDFDAFGYER
ncbi:MAG: sulfotransferase family 2 domain-containing protein [Candidatus Thalassarchaeaceae archaeon]|jgi:hypothetical protein|nr:sulfotransferase family 2 domain-containing protein [Candidatus Thalassarchaeaceae archaeon]MDP6703477.1 sulfotransferase family 2 domain-containing protein [Candidatus Thalassarchaeaceae archaeon]MDP7004356.1 sulfotransferase family 2 domain-containing protein [Candidatus Thalassarchaeaceae archaeon]